MPSTLVHLAIAGLVAGTLLHRDFDLRSLGLVLAATAIPDLDALLAPVMTGAHRAALHTLLLPLVMGVIFVFDIRRRNSVIRRRYGRRGVKIGLVAVFAMVFAGILPDLTHTGVNLFYPLHDRFYTIDGKLLISNQRGLVQTLIEFAPDNGGKTVGGTTKTAHHASVVNPTDGPEPKNVERKLWIAGTGLKLLLILTSTIVISIRLLENKYRQLGRS